MNTAADLSRWDIISNITESFCTLYTVHRTMHTPSLYRVQRTQHTQHCKLGQLPSQRSLTALAPELCCPPAVNMWETLPGAVGSGFKAVLTS